MAKKSTPSKKGKSSAKSKKETKKKTSLKWYSAVAAIVILLAAILLENAGIDIGELLGGTNDVNDKLFVHYIDVGQGDCIFIESEEQNMLIDCGESSESDVVTAYLQEQNVNKIDYLVGTHPHSDHMGGMSAIIDNFEIDTFLMPYLPDDDVPTTKYFEKMLLSLDAKGVEITNPDVGDVFHIGSADARIIAPNSKEYGGANDYSIGIILEHGENSFIFTGDAETPAEDEMIDNGLLKDIDVYKAGHHGSSTSSSEKFLDIIKPEYVVIMCGEGNSYGHPHDNIIKRLGRYADAENIYRTDLCGTVVAESDGSTISFTTEK